MITMVFDSSVYGELALDWSFLNEVSGHVNASFAVFGSEVVEGELQNTPDSKKIKEGKFKGMSLKVFLTTAYKLVTRRSETLSKTDLVEIVAARYYVFYSKEAAKTGLAKKEGKLLNDFRIVASASLAGAGFLVTADSSSMLNADAVKAYKVVNGVFQLKTPVFLAYSDFKRKFSEIVDELTGENDE
ncbi:hypothetical protein HYU17_03375 [Candidatus Woesearchaeota archaeon]|nr:hypothetical protein [Candidatus Woesearchaeota archaeon]